MKRKVEADLKGFQGPRGWKWVRLVDLANLISRSPKDTWKSYFDLSWDVADDILPWSPDLSEVITEENLEPKDFSTIFVPEDWAMDVIKAWEKGYMKVKAIVLSPPYKKPKHTIHIIVCGIRIAAVGIK